MADRSWELFWGILEDYTAVWTALAIAAVLFGAVSLVSLLAQPFDTSDPSVVIAVVNIVLVAVLLVPLGYVLYRIRQRAEQRNY